MKYSHTFNMCMLRCHTSELFQARSILETEFYMKKMKLGFFKRLVTNEYTNAIISELFKLKYAGCFNHEITEILKLDLNCTLEEALLATEIKPIEISRTTKELKDMSITCERVIRIKKLLLINNEQSRDELFELIKH